MKIQIKIKMSTQTVVNVPVCIYDFQSTGIHFPMSHWTELAYAESIQASNPIDLVSADIHSRFLFQDHLK